MNVSMVTRLVRKDCSLMRWSLAAWMTAALAALVLTALVGGSICRR
jgi:hypothetical protein